MKRLFSIPTLALSLAVLASAASTATAATSVILFSDDFEGRVTGSGDGNGNPAGAGNGSSSWGTNNNNLGGTNTAAYITSPSAALGGGANQVVGSNTFSSPFGNQGHLISGSSVVGYQNWLSSAPDGFEVEFRFDRNTDPASTGGGFLAVGLGVNSLDPVDLGPSASIARTNFGLLFQQANAGNAANASTFDSNVLINNFDYLDPNSPADVLLAITPTLSGAYGIGATIGYSVSVNGTVLNTGTFTGNGEDLSRVSFSNNNFAQRYVDNIVIRGITATAIPEPSSIGALAIFGLGGAVIARRRKKAAAAKA